jgi:ketosteroid isomerase-like protein
MSQENLDLVRRIYEENLIDSDHGQLLSLTTSEVQYVNPPEAVDPGVRRGRAEFAEALRNASDFFERGRHDVNRLFDGGDTIVAAVSFVARSRGSETEIVQHEAHTWTLVDGTIVRFEWGRDLGAALDAAGLAR